MALNYLDHNEYCSVTPVRNARLGSQPVTDELTDATPVVKVSSHPNGPYLTVKRQRLTLGDSIDTSYLNPPGELAQEQSSSSGGAKTVLLLRNQKQIIDDTY